ncbi:MAG: prolipoprotein diacylglyceryl transferase [Chloroflexi bacterium]|nr:prolipoprotein diacylglyceryl transferase [Chloroflexota bacterium]
MPIPTPSEIAISIGPFQIRWYSLMILLGILVGQWVASRAARVKGENPDHVVGFLVPAIILGLIGARLYHVVSAWSFYVQYPELIPAIWRGGIGIYGGIAGAILGILIYARWQKLNLLRWLDIGAPGLLIGQAIGRWGNFFNQELYGPPTDLPWGIPIDKAHRLPGYESDSYKYFHPLFFYEFLWNLAGFLVLMWVLRRFGRRMADGDLALTYLVWYPLGRFWLEGLRLDSWTIFGIATAQWVSGILMLAAVIVLLYRKRPKLVAPPAAEAGPGGGTVAMTSALPDAEPPVSVAASQQDASAQGTAEASGPGQEAPRT